MLRLFTESRLPPHLCHKPPILRSTAKVVSGRGPLCLPSPRGCWAPCGAAPLPGQSPAWEEPRAADFLGLGRESPFTEREGRSRGQSGVHTRGRRRAGLLGPLVSVRPTPRSGHFPVSSANSPSQQERPWRTLPKPDSVGSDVLEPSALTGKRRDSSPLR